MNWLFRFVAIVAVALRLRPAEEVVTPAEEASLRETLGDALRPDGSIDLDRLRAMSIRVDTDTLRNEVADANDSMAAVRHA